MHLAFSVLKLNLCVCWPLRLRGISSDTEMDAGMSFSSSCEWQREEWDE